MTTRNGNKLEHGELGRIILGTVVAFDRPVRPIEVWRKLDSEGLDVTCNNVTARLNMLADDGRIDHPCRGYYEGV